MGGEAGANLLLCYKVSLLSGPVSVDTTGILHAIKRERVSRMKGEPRSVRRSAGFVAFFFWVLGTVSASAQAHLPLPPVRPPELGASPAAPVVPAPPSSSAVPSVQPLAAAEACLEELKASHVEAEAASSPGASPNDCSIVAPVRITSIGLHGGAKLDLPAHPLLDCSFALAFAGFIRDLVAPLPWRRPCWARRSSRSTTGPGYYCPQRRPGFRSEGQPTRQGHRDRRLRYLARRSAAPCGRAWGRVPQEALFYANDAARGLRMVHDHIGPR